MECFDVVIEVPINVLKNWISDLFNFRIGYYSAHTKIFYPYSHPMYWMALRLLKKKTIDYLRFFFKKYIYTVNHKRIAINYLIFVTWSGLSGTALATIIRIELAYPGSNLFKGDSLKYL